MRWMIFCVPFSSQKKRKSPVEREREREVKNKNKISLSGDFVVQNPVLGQGDCRNYKKTVEIAQLWQHNRGNYTTPTIFQKKKKKKKKKIKFIRAIRAATLVYSTKNPVFCPRGGFFFVIFLCNIRNQSTEVSTCARSILLFFSTFCKTHNIKRKMGPFLLIPHHIL